VESVEDDMTTRSTAETVTVRERAAQEGEGDQVRQDALEVSVNEVEEPLAEDAGYGYGV